MMMQPSASLSWIVTLFVFIVIVGVVLGAALSHTDFFNFNTSAADMHARDQATDAQAQKDAIDRKVYQAQRDAEIAALQRAAAFQAVKNSIDQQVYRVQKIAQVTKQIADAKQHEAQQLANAEAERQRQLAQVEVQREQQLAQIRASEQDQARTRAEQASRAAEELKWLNLFNIILAFSFVVIAVAIAAGCILSAVAWAGPRLQRPKPTATLEPFEQDKPSTLTAPELKEAAPKPTTPQRRDREYWKGKRIEARANEVALRDTQLHVDLPQGLNPADYKDLPLAAMKGDSTSNSSDPQGQASNS
jgi:hypothetical protein